MLTLEDEQVILLGNEEITWVCTKQSASQRFAQQAAEETAKKAEVPPEYREFKSIFEKKSSERLPKHQPWDHKIKMIEGYKMKKLKDLYQIPPKLMPIFNDWIKENLAKGYIRPSKSPYASGFFFVSKKTKGEYRACQDYRDLNEGTVKDKYPLPHVPDLLLKLQGAKYFTKLDLRWGYNNVRIKEGDEKYAAFKTPAGLFEPTVMFFGLCNSPATFQRMMNEHFRDLVDEKWIVIYMDDILICAKTKEELEKRTKQVLRRLKEKDLFLKLEKCRFAKTKIEFLGLIISEGQIRMDAAKLAGIKSWPAPTMVKQVHSFLGFCNFYRKFIGHYADITRPLTNLTRKDIKFEWTDDCQRAMDDLKERFLEEPILNMPDTTKQFVVETDASKWATGGILKQIGDDGLMHPCGYISHTLMTAERNYQIYDRELLAVIRAIKTWKYLLMGAAHPVIIHCDHKNLTFYKKINEVSPRQARWLSLLQEYDLRWEYVPGTKLIQADALSRRPDHVDTDEGNDDEFYVLIPPERIIARLSREYDDRIMETILRSTFTSIADEIKSLTAKDRFASLVKANLSAGRTPIKSVLTDWSNQDGVIRYQNKIYIPEDNDLRSSIIKLHHDTPHAGHLGCFKTIKLRKQDYWWPGMNQTVTNWIKGCATCQQMKVNTHPTKPGLKPIKSDATRPFQQVTVDFITALPPSDGYDSIMVVVAHGLTKGVIYTPCNKTIDALSTAQMFIDHVWKRFGLPDIIISDRGPQFGSRVFQEMCKLLKIDHRMSTAYHPQTDGETERVNQEIETYLRIFCASEPKKWNTYLPMAEFAHNNRAHETSKMSPFQIMYGTDPKGIPTAFPRINTPAIENRLTELMKIRQEALTAHELARQLMISRSKSKPFTFKEGDLVWLENRHLKIPYPSSKLAPKREGPFKIEKVLGRHVYQLKLPFQWGKHPVFNATLLTPYHETDEHGPNYIKPPPDLIDGEEQYEVETILAHRRKGKGIEYLIKWKEYSSNENTWEPESNLSNSEEILDEYKKEHQLDEVQQKSKRPLLSSSSRKPTRRSTRYTSSN